MKIILNRHQSLKLNSICVQNEILRIDFVRKIGYNKNVYVPVFFV